MNRLSHSLDLRARHENEIKRQVLHHRDGAFVEIVVGMCRYLQYKWFHAYDGIGNRLSAVFALVGEDL